MNDPLTLWLWCGGVGWFLLTYAIELGGGRHPASTFVWVLFYWMIGLDAIASLLGIVAPVVQKIGLGWRFVAWYVVLPYVLAAWRLWRLRKKRLVAGGSGSRQPAARNAP